MRVVGWNGTGDWMEYLERVTSITRLSTHKWDVTYTVGYVRGYHLILICDSIWIEAR